jgi:hypothetical protein
MLHLACGPGGYLQVGKKCGVKQALGVDLLADADVALRDHEYRRASVAQPLDLGATFDMVLCLDTSGLEDETAIANLLATIDRHGADVVVFCGREPGQPGTAHGEKPLGVWLDLFERHGWRPDLLDTLGARTISTLAALRRNLLVLKRIAASDESTVARLLNIAAKPFAWYEQPAGLCAEALGDDGRLIAGFAADPAAAAPAPAGG